MPQIPDATGRRPTPRFGAPDQASPVVQPGEIAQGRALQGLGQDISRYFLREQARQEKVLLDGKTIEYKAKVQELETKYRELKGEQVANDTKFFERFVAEHDQIREEVLGTVESSDVRVALGQRTQLGEINFKEGLTNHLVREREVYHDQVYTGKLVLSKNEMASNYLDDSRLMQARDDIENTIKDYGKDRGMAQEAIDATVLGHLTEGHLSVIQRAVDDDNYDWAKEYYQDFKDEISGDKRDDVERLLKSAGIKEQSIGLVDDLFTRRKTDLAEMTEGEFAKYGADYIRKNASNDVRDDAISRFKTRIGEASQIDKQLKAEFSDRAYEYYNAAIDSDLTPMEAFNAIPETVLDGMDPKARAAMRNMAEKTSQGQTIHTDFTAWDYLYTLATSEDPDDVEKFRDEDLRAYTDRISTAHLMQFKKMQEDEVELTMASTMSDIKGILAEDIGLTKLEASDMLDRELLDFQARNRRIATKVEARDIAKSLAAEILFKRSGPVGMGRPPYPRNVFFGRDLTRSVFEADIEGIPNEEVDEYYREIQRLKMLDGDTTPITEQEIIYLYNKTNPDAKTRKLSAAEIAEIEK